MLYLPIPGSVCVCARVRTQSCLTLCDPVEPARLICPFRILEWFAISFSRGFLLTHGLNLCLLHWQVSSSHQGSPSLGQALSITPI